MCPVKEYNYFSGFIEYNVFKERKRERRNRQYISNENIP